jgi:hypothetical protein
MAQIQGLTLFQTNTSITIQNTSEPGYDQYVLTTLDSGQSIVLSDNFPPQSQLKYSYSSAGRKVLTLTAQRLLKNNPITSTYSITFDVGFAPSFTLTYSNRSDRQPAYTQNYVIAGQTFNLQIIQGNTATSPTTYSWNFNGGTTYSTSTSSNQIIQFPTVGIKNVGLTISNRFGTNFSQITLNSILTPALKIIGNPTFGNIRINDNVSLSTESIQNNGHILNDISVLWQIDGQAYNTPTVDLVFGSTGTKGITLFYFSNILSGLSGHTYTQYNVLREEFPVYYDPELMIAFTPSESQYSHYQNEMKKYGIEYKYLSPVAIGGYANSTYNASIAAYNSFTPEQKIKPVLINAEYPWLVILYRKENLGVDSSWFSNQTVIQEAQRQGITLSGLTLAGFKQLAIKCWTDIVDELRSKGCPKMIHYASTAVAFSDYAGVPIGMLEYGPLAGVTTNHYWYQAHPTWNPVIRDVFESKIIQNSYGALLKAQINADANGAAAYSFIPNSPAGLCGISYWNSSEITLVGYSGGTTFINSTDFTEQVLEDAVKVTSAKMWLEFYRACERSVDLGFNLRREIPQKIASILTLSIPASFLFTNPGGGWRSRFKFQGSMKKDPERTAENEVAAIFETNNRINYSNYETIKKPDEIWIWDAIKYYNLNVPGLFITDTGITTADKIQTLMMRNALEIEFFNRPELSPGNTLWYTGSTADNINYYKNNSLSNYYWNNPSNLWWGITGGTYGNLLPHPCSLTPNSSIAPWLNFNQSINRNQVFTALKHKLSSNSLNYLIKVREKLNELF